MQTERIKYAFVAVCCLTTAASSGGTVDTPTFCNPNVASGYLRPVEVSEQDCDVTEGVSITLVTDAARFRQLADAWRRDNRYRSSITRMVLHPAYQQIMQMREGALPFIFQELKTKGGHWFFALQTITNQTVGTPGDDFEIVRRAWLEWGQAHGYLRS